MNRHQSDGAKAGPSAYSLIEEKQDAYGLTEAGLKAHHNKPEEHEEEEFSSLEEALTS